MITFYGGTNSSFAVGHMALAYILGKASAKLLKINISIPLILVLSLLPDIDIILLRELHRGPTHSIVTAVAVFIPVFCFYRRRAIPYFLALVSHLIADFFIGGKLQLLWPLTTREFGLHELGSYYFGIYSPVNIALELAFFTVATIVMYKTQDLFKLFLGSKLDLILTVPIFTVLLPTFLAYPLQVPVLLILPHLFYLALFSVAVLATFLRGLWKQHK